MTKESQTSTEATINLSPLQFIFRFKRASKGTRETPIQADPLQLGHKCPHAGQPLARPPPPGGLCNLCAAAGDFESRWPATAAANASLGSGCCSGGRRKRAKRFLSHSLSHRGAQHPRTPLLLLNQSPTHKSHLGGGGSRTTRGSCPTSRERMWIPLSRRTSARVPGCMEGSGEGLPKG